MVRVNIENFSHHNHKAVYEEGCWECYGDKHAVTVKVLLCWEQSKTEIKCKMIVQQYLITSLEKLER